MSQRKLTGAARDAATLLEGLADLPPGERMAAVDRLIEELETSVTALRARANRAERVLAAVREALAVD